MENRKNGKVFSNSFPRILGITGGIGSGKSTVAKFIEEMGYPVYYSDDRAKQIVNEDHNLREAIIELLGEESYEGNQYNRSFVSRQVFQNSNLLNALNELIHPFVKKDFEKWKKNISTRFAFKETALLFELRLHEQSYKSILVTADDALRMKRVMDRDGKTYREVEAIMRRQMPERDKIKKADFIIYNNGTIEELKAQTKIVLEKVEELET